LRADPAGLTTDGNPKDGDVELTGANGATPSSSAAAAAAAATDTAAEPAEVVQQRKLYEPIEIAMATTRRNTELVKKLFEEQLKAATETERQAVVRKMNTILNETNAAGLDTKRRLDNITKDNQDHARKNPGAATTQIRFNMQGKYMKEYQTVIQSFNDVSDRFKKGLQDATRRQLVALGLDQKKIDQVVESGQAQEVLKKSMSEDLSDVIDSIQERHASILALERSVREVQELFIDLAHLVDLQQEYLDNIETHIKNAKGYAEQGEKDIRDGAKYQDEARKRQCCIVVIVVCVLVVVLVPTLLKVVPSS